MSEASITTEILAGCGLSLSQAAHRFPPFREGKSVCPSTVFRWIHSGVRLPDGRRVRLEACRLGGRWLTSGPAIERFIHAQTPSLESERTLQTSTPAQAAKRAERAGTELERLHGF